MRMHKANARSPHQTALGFDRGDGEMRMACKALIGMLIPLLLGFAFGYRVGEWNSAGERTSASTHIATSGEAPSGGQSRAVQSDWQKAFARIAREAEPAVVHIRTVRIVADPFEQLLHEFFGEPLPRSEGIGSGFICAFPSRTVNFIL